MSAVQVCLVVVLSACAVYCARVRTSAGELEGSEYVTSNGKQIFTFLGVPYAKPPVGDNRFKEPKPMKSWYGVWPATEYSPGCYQYLPDFGKPEQFTGNEDCLYLNIYTPTLSNTSDLPVLVYIHGGAFMFGESTDYKPITILENQDIVYVSINYRLGVFGFLSTQDNVVPGNNGLKDQVLALKWVQENIANFGGNKDKVTIGGNSAGGASVHLHFLSPLSRGLFDKGISSSGSALMPWALTDQPLRKATMLAESLSCPTDNTEIMVKCLKQRRSKQISSKIQEIFQPWLLNPFSPFGPVVENTTRQAFLSEHPYELLMNGNIYDGPLLANINTEEGLYPAAAFIDRNHLLQDLNTNWHSIAPHLLDYNFTVPTDQLDFVSDKIKSFYFGNSDISSDTRGKVIEMLGDRMFNADMNLAMRLHASAVSSPVYMFIFAYRGQVSLSDPMSSTRGDFGVSHFDDIYYLLMTPDAILESEPDKAIMLDLINIWTSFMKTGQPVSPTGVEWKPISQDSGETGLITHLLIKSHEKMNLVTKENIGNYNFWNSINLQENVKSNKILNLKEEL